MGRHKAANMETIDVVAIEKAEINAETRREYERKFGEFVNWLVKNRHELIEVNDEIAWSRVKADDFKEFLVHVRNSSKKPDAKSLGVRHMLHLSSPWETYFCIEISLGI